MSDEHGHDLHNELNDDEKKHEDSEHLVLEALHSVTAFEE